MGIKASGVFAGVIVSVYCLVAAFTLTLMLSRDLGKKYSLGFCWSMVAITLAVALALMVIYPGTILKGTDEGCVAAFRAFSNSFLAKLVFAMTMAKYQDKTARGTK